MVRKVGGIALFVAALSMGVGAQDAKTVISNASKAMGADNLSSITYSGSAASAAFGQTRHLSGPWVLTTRISNYTRAIDFNQPASRATGSSLTPANIGLPPSQPIPYTQNITPANAGWTQQLEIWTMPWAFLKGAAANNATVRTQKMNGKTYSVVSWMTTQKSPGGIPYTLTGFINDQNIVERVDTAVENTTMGDLLIETDFTGYKDFGGVKVPGKISQKRTGFPTWEVDIANATPNPPNITQLLTPPAPAAGAAAGGAPAGGGGAPAPPAVASEKLADGVYRITGGYVALAVEMKDYVVMLESGQSEARGLAVLAETKKLFPNKPLRYVVNTHAHSDHTGGLAPVVAQGITIITQQNNKDFLDKALSTPRTLVGDTLSKTPMKPKFETVGEKKVLKDENHSIELYHVREADHTDGLLVGYLPKEKILFSADFNVPAANQAFNQQPFQYNVTLLQFIDRMKLDVDKHVLVHAPVPDRPLGKADLVALVAKYNEAMKQTPTTP